MSRLISLNVHSALEIALGTAIMAAPFVFGLGTAALVTGFVVGVAIMGLGIASTGGGRGSIPVSAHAAYDGGIALLVGAGLVQTLLTASTRYSVPANA